MTTPDWLTEYQAFKTLTSHANGEFIRFYLTTGRDGIIYTHSQLPDGAGLPRYSCRLTAADGTQLALCKPSPFAGLPYLVAVHGLNLPRKFEETQPAYFGKVARKTGSPIV